MARNGGAVVCPFLFISYIRKYTLCPSLKSFVGDLGLKMPLERLRLGKQQQIILCQLSSVCLKYFVSPLNLRSEKFVLYLLKSFLLKEMSLYILKMWLYKAHNKCLPKPQTLNIRTKKSADDSYNKHYVTQNVLTILKTLGSISLWKVCCRAPLVQHQFELVKGHRFNWHFISNWSVTVT